MIDPNLKEQLGYDSEITDAELLEAWKERLGIVCKPCWELKYCPYGPLVEEFPLPDLSKEEALTHHEYMKRALAEGVFDADRKTNASPLMTREMAQHEIDTFDLKDYPDSPPPQIIKEGFCRIFGHMCPVFFVAEPFTETKEGRRMTRNIDRATMFKVARRDNYRCQICGENVEDDDIAFDHIIPFSRGGQTDVNNLRLTHSSCNGKKSDKIEFLDDD
jgi:hypothetical protein